MHSFIFRFHFASRKINNKIIYFCYYVIKKEAGIVGLELNPQKSEVIGVNSDLIPTILSALSGIRVVNATLLG